MAKKQAPSKSSKHKSASSLKQKAAPEVTLEMAKNVSPSIAAAPPNKSALAPATSSAPTSTLKSTPRTIPAEAALSFLRHTKGLLSWSLRELSQTLNISREEAERVVALLQIQGYVQPEGHKAGEWVTTPSGETVSGAKPPRFDRETVEAALASLRQRIEGTNNDRAAKFQITRAVAFGGFLAKDRARVQSADVGVELVRRDRERTSDEISAPHSAVEAREERHFLRQMRGRSALINLKNYSPWMGTRTHQKLF